MTTTLTPPASPASNSSPSCTHVHGQDSPMRRPAARRRPSSRASGRSPSSPAPTHVGNRKQPRRAVGGWCTDFEEGIPVGCDTVRRQPIWWPNRAQRSATSGSREVANESAGDGADRDYDPKRNVGGVERPI